MPQGANAETNDQRCSVMSPETDKYIGVVLYRSYIIEYMYIRLYELYHALYIIYYIMFIVIYVLCIIYYKLYSIYHRSYNILYYMHIPRTSIKLTPN